ncbi:aldo/keto reductase [Caloramator australicus]|uniref:Oxidoreductase, aldo/keto reductase family n=1 Tax=Caloramator australicus RC3 TaxID=857293 RepID=I7J5Z2_9CLOT|nr:aldo/keto reductase [Caloramator australicus]CCJ34142.1 Oxidoreductase, aldo/keto reductase family [Caloramator australicus RC3]
MQYRKFAKDLEVSALGFGMMRLPILNGDEGQIDKEKAFKMVRYAIDNGVNYIDTAYPYHKGNSEIFTAEVLKGGYRKKVLLATKMPVWLVNEKDDFERLLNEQLNKLETNHIDCYLLHALSKNSWEKVYNLGVLDFLVKAKNEGKIKKIGFSFHDEFNVFKDIIDAFEWDFSQIQFNYLDEDEQAGLRGLKYAHSKGISIIVMEPLKGGKLAKEPPEKVKDIWNSHNVKRTPAEWALRYVLNFEEVSLLLSEMSTIEQVEENLKVINDAYPYSLNEEEIKLIKKVKETYKSLNQIGCTSCKYCMPCPFGVDIPRNFSVYNSAFIYNDLEGSRKVYNNYINKENRAENCKECGKCEDVCPQKLPIRSLLKDVHKTLAE